VTKWLCAGKQLQCSQPGNRSVLSQDGTGDFLSSRPVLQKKLPDDLEWRTLGPAAPHRDITPVMSWVGFPQFMEVEYETAGCATLSTYTTKGLLHALNWAEVGSVKYTGNHANIKILNGFL